MHFSECPSFGKDIVPPGECQGCAPAAARLRAYVCERCYSRSRSLFVNAPDLVGRLRSLADPMKAAVYDRIRVSTSSGEAGAAPVPAELLDAARDVQGTLAAWAAYFGEPTGRAKTDAVAAFEDAHRASLAVLAELDRVVNDRELVDHLSAGVLDRNAPDEDGVRGFWTIADAMAKFGPERHDRTTREEWVDDVTEELHAEGMPEWGDPLLGRDDAETLAGSSRTLRRWEKAGEIAPAGRIVIAGILTKLYRRSEVIATGERMGERQRARLAQYRDDEDPGQTNGSTA
ncbi:hypothetical protein QM517_02105 [Rhodococcus sp. IEGM 1404]|nr:hypothetical protein [Microbacterium sp. IEGM 1404]